MTSGVEGLQRRREFNQWRRCEVAKNKQSVTQKDVFVSHATADVDIVARLVRLLTENGVHQNRIFCTSLKGYGVQPTKDFNDYIKVQIQHPRVVILVLSQMYFDRTFTLCELGASWALSHVQLPVIVPPLRFADLGEPYGRIQGVKINDTEAMTEAYEALMEAIGVPRVATAAWMASVKSFVDDISILIQAQSKPTKVSGEEHTRLEGDFKDAVQTIQQRDAEIVKLKATVDKLTQAKDAEEVREILLADSTYEGRLHQLTSAVKRAFDKTPLIVEEMLFRHYAGLNSPGGREAIEELENAKSMGYLRRYSDEDDYELVTDDPSVEAAIEALDDFDTFVNEVLSSDSKEAEAFQKWFREEYEFKLQFNNRRLWMDLFGLLNTYGG